jgi:hypothetical protein
LERLPQSSIAFADVHSLLPGKLLSVECGCNVIDTTVNTNNVATFRWGGNFAVNNNVDVEFFCSLVVANSSESELLPNEQLLLEISNDKWEFKSAHHRRDGSFLKFLIEGEGALVKAYAGGV